MSWTEQDRDNYAKFCYVLGQVFGLEMNPEPAKKSEPEMLQLLSELALKVGQARYRESLMAITEFEIQPSPDEVALLMERIEKAKAAVTQDLL